MTLTAVIITSVDADETKLQRAVRSVRFADEVLLVRKKRRIEDFAAARNKTLVKAQAEWVLFMDSDEEVPAQLANEICQVGQELKVEKGKLKNGYRLRRSDRFLGKWLEHGETAGVRLLRLARKDAGRWRRPVHEVWEVEGKIGELKSPLLHYSHETTDEMVEKIDRYSTLEATYRFNNRLTKQRINILLEMVVFPSGKFIQNYFFRLGFLDGVVGFIHAMMMSCHSFLVRAKQLTADN